jgi:hypothetical protein
MCINRVKIHNDFRNNRVTSYEHFDRLPGQCPYSQPRVVDYKCQAMDFLNDHNETPQFPYLALNALGHSLGPNWVIG